MPPLRESAERENAEHNLPGKAADYLPGKADALPAEPAGRKAARLLLGTMLMAAGTTHLTIARKAFRAQVPDWAVNFSPYSKDDIVLMSGIAEIGLGAALAFLPKERKRMGVVAASFFTAIFPGNISQYTERRDAFGLDTDAKRLGRLFFQPLLVGWALWVTGACDRRQHR